MVEVRKQQLKNVTKCLKNVKIVEFHYHIWNHHEKCIQISTNMPSIGLVIPEITFGMLENKSMLHGKTKLVKCIITGSNVLKLKSQRFFLDNTCLIMLAIHCICGFH